MARDEEWRDEFEPWDPADGAAGEGLATAARVQINRAHPACLMFLLDQSGSMRQPLAGAGESKADYLSKAINRLLNSLTKACTKGHGDTVEVRHYFDVGLLCYGNPIVGRAFGGALAGRDLVSLPELADNPLRIERRMVKHNDGNGGVIDLEEQVPIWLEPVSARNTPMREGLEEAHRLLADWVDAHADSYPPLVLHITDGRPTSGDPEPAAEALKALATQHGNVVLLNCHVTQHSVTPVAYPEGVEDLPAGDEYAARLFRMSSVLRPDMVQMARETGHTTVREQSRGYVYNGGMADLHDFLSIGTIQTQTLR